MTKRTDSYRNAIYNAPFEICVERARYWTESYKDTEGEHPTVRAAKALEKTLDSMSIFIRDDEQLVGHRTSKLLGVILPVERGDINNGLYSDLKIIKNRKNKPYHISEEDEELLFKEILPYWKRKTVSEKKLKMFKKFKLLSDSGLDLSKMQQLRKSFGSKWVRTFLKLFQDRGSELKYFLEFMKSSTPLASVTNLDDQGHLVMGHNNLLKWGYEGIKNRAIEQLNQAELVTIETNGGSFAILEKPTTYDKLVYNFQFRFSKTNGNTEDKAAFLNAVVICCDAAIRYIRRYAKLAKNKAIKEVDSTRKLELTAISKRCNWISSNKPRNFSEALQLVWFNEVMANISHGLGGILAVGRPDQYLYPYYLADKLAGLISDEDVVELIEEFIIKLSSNLMIVPSFDEVRNAPELGSDHLALTVGGVDIHGNDATNELSYLICDAIENVKCTTISFSARIAPEVNPRKWIERIVDIYRITNGTAIYNDDVIIPALVNGGCSLEDARDYALVGCVEPAPQGNAFPITAGNESSLSGLFEMVINNGQTRLGSKFVDMESFTSKNFTCYEDLWQKYKEFIKHGVDLAVKCANIKDIVHGENYPNPFVSMSLDGCIENALDMTQGGAKYNFNTLSSSGIGTVVDSLCALKKLVFEDKKISLEHMLDVLNNNYKKEELLRTKLKNKIQKFGNDIEYVDSIAQDLLNVYCDEINSHSTVRLPGQFRPCLFSAGTHVLTGNLLGATPDGRKAGEPISNSLSPSNGAEKNGPTAVLNSIAKLPTEKMGSGMSFNMRLLPSLIETKEERFKLADMILSYFEKGGMHVQFNIIDQNVLRDAQLNPENYKDLIVRVSGYNAYFAYLDKSLQDDIIDRVQFDRL